MRSSLGLMVCLWAARLPGTSIGLVAGVQLVTAIMAGLVPILWSQGTGADVMKRIAAPMVGGMITSTVLTLVVIPAIYSLWKERALGKLENAQ